MPRDSNGVYTLPVGNPVISGTIITSTWANGTCGDIGNELTDSLSRSGEGGMLAPLRLNDGTIGFPGLSWVSEVNSGLYLFGAQDVRFAMAGSDLVKFVPVASGSLFVNNTVTGTGFERVLTTSDKSAAFPGNNPTLANADAAIIIGTASPNTDPHIAAGPSLIQAKANATTAANLTLQGVGGGVRINSAGTPYIETPASGTRELIIRAASATDLFPNTILFRNNGPVNGALIGYSTSTDFDVTNGVLNAKLQLKTQNGAGTQIVSVEPNIATSNLGAPMMGVRFPVLRLGSNPDQPATIGSSNHFFQVGDSTINTRMSGQAMCTNTAAAGGILSIQNIANGYASLGDKSATGAYFQANGTTDVSITHKNDVVLRSVTPATGGIKVNGLYGLERVLTASDSPIGTTKVLSTPVTITSSTAPVNVAALTFALAANSKYAVSGFFNVYWPGTGDCYLEVAEGLIGDSIAGVYMPPTTPFGAYTYNFTGGVIGARMNLNITSTLLGFGFTFEGTVLTGASASSLTVNICTPVSSPDTFELRDLSRLTCILVP